MTEPNQNIPAGQPNPTPAPTPKPTPPPAPVAKPVVTPEQIKASQTIVATTPINRPGVLTTEETGVERRTFIKWLTLGWIAFIAAIGGYGTMFLRYMFPNVLFEPKQTFRAGFPDDYPINEVSERWKDAYAVWIVRQGDTIYALSTVCTHLGCTPNWLPNDNKFKCPCHGSGFYKTGINFEGPAPRPLERFKIYLADDGQIVVDKTKKFQQEKGEWSDSESYLVV
jgi:cytochrome b6-f complex iron-sulfur subunit